MVVFYPLLIFVKGNQMFRRVKNVLFFLMMFILIQGCNKSGDNKKGEPYYGAELYNAAYVHVGNETRHVIRVMSLRDLSTYTGARIDSIGGAFYYRLTVEDGELELKGYHLYYLCLDVYDVEFEADQIDIKSIDLFFSDGSIASFCPDKCRILKGKGNLNQEYVHINGCPLNMPASMKTLPLELSADNKVTVTNVYLTNDEMKLTLFPNAAGDRVSEFCEFTISAAGNVITWVPVFEVGDESTGSEGIEAYKSYSTSIVIEYNFNGQEYYCTPGVNSTTYNGFGVTADTIEAYFDYLGI